MKLSTYLERGGVTPDPQYLTGVKAELSLLPAEAQESIAKVHQDLQDRAVHPSGTFDKGGRWYATYEDLIDARYPSRAWPYSHLKAARTKKYVMRVAVKFNIRKYEDLRKAV